MLYLMVFENRAKFVDIDMRNISEEDLSKIQKDFGDGKWSADLFALWPDQAIDGVFYDYELAGPGGASFIIWQWPGITNEQVHKAKTKIHLDHDVVNLSIRKFKFVSHLWLFEEQMKKWEGLCHA